jgi:hypothetical protein
MGKNGESCLKMDYERDENTSQNLQTKLILEIVSKQKEKGFN